LNGVLRAYVAPLSCGAAALATGALVLRDRLASSPAGELAIAALAALAVAVIVGTVVLRPARRRLAESETSLARLTRELEGLEWNRTREEEVLRTLAEFQIPRPPSDEQLDEAASELTSAQQDEERLRDRRRAIEEEVRRVVRFGRDLVNASSSEALPWKRLPALVLELEAGVRLASDGIDAVLQHSLATGEIVTLVGETASSGRASTTRAGQGSQDLERQLGEIHRLVLRLETRSKEIGQVLNMLNDITEQTNLLALNAAIIAAQAGEHGKGFGVVAEEMRNLSERASSSTKETELLAQTLRSEVTQAARIIADSQDVAKAIRVVLLDAAESAGVLAELGLKGRGAARDAISHAEKQAAHVRDLSGRTRQLAEERDHLEHVQRDVLTPMRQGLEATIGLLEAEWNAGALRETLRARLRNAVEAIRHRRTEDRSAREQLERRVEGLRERSRAFASVVEEGRRRDHVVQQVAQEIRALARND